MTNWKPHDTIETDGVGVKESNWLYTNSPTD